MSAQMVIVKVELNLRSGAILNWRTGTNNGNEKFTRLGTPGAIKKYILFNRLQKGNRLLKLCGFFQTIDSHRKPSLPAPSFHFQSTEEKRLRWWPRGQGAYHSKRRRTWKPLPRCRAYHNLSIPLILSSTPSFRIFGWPWSYFFYCL